MKAPEGSSKECYRSKLFIQLSLCASETEQLLTHLFYVALSTSSLSFPSSSMLLSSTTFRSLLGQILIHHF